MGAQLAGYFDKIGAEYGTTGRMKLAMLTLVSSVNATKEEDSTENVRKFEEAMAQVRKTLQQ